MSYSVAMNDNLYQAFHAFKHGREHNKRLIEKLLHLYKPPHITNAAQLDRLGIEDNPLKMQLLQNSLTKQGLDELSLKTDYKILLSDTDGEFPLVNIYGNQLANNYTITCEPGQPRARAIAHIEALLGDAGNVLIYDRYIMDNWQECKRIFDLLPRKNLTIEFSHRLNQQYVTEIKKFCPDWKVKADQRQVYRELHDRYLLINRKMEIILSSGIYYLFDDTRECTLVFRKKE